jgi:sugar porter (SP) family MFS transporter
LTSYEKGILLNNISYLAFTAILSYPDHIYLIVEIMAWQQLSDAQFDSKAVWKMGLAVTLGSFVFGYNIGVFTSCQPNVSATLDWGDNENLFVTLYSSLMPLGAMCGALITARLSSNFGRRKLMILTDLIGIIGASFIMIPTNPTFGIGRFVTGFASGIFAALCPQYINESAPVEISGKIGTLVQFNVTFAIAVAYALALPLPTGDYDSESFNYWWIAMFGLQILFLGIQLALFFFVYTYDTPKWLVEQGRKEEALQSLRQVYSNQYAEEQLRVLTSSSKSVELKAPGEATSGGNNPTFGELFCKKKYAKMNRLGIMINTLQQWSGVNAIMFYSTVIFESQTGSVFIARVFTLIVGVVNMLATLAVIPFIDKTGRKPLCLVGEVGMSGCLICMGLFSGFIDGGIIATLAFTLLFLCFFEMSLGPVTWIYCGEILNEKGVSVAVATNWIHTFLVVLIFPPLQGAIGITAVFFIYAAFCGLGFIYIFFDMVETKGKTKDEIAKIFNLS